MSLRQQRTIGPVSIHESYFGGPSGRGYGFTLTLMESSIDLHGDGR